MSRQHALDALSYIIHEIRSDWDRAGILAVLQRQPDRTDLADLAVAAITAAHTRRDQRSPTVISYVTGSHWQHVPSGQRPAVDLPAFRPPDDTTPAPPDVIATCRAKLRGKDQPHD